MNPNDPTENDAIREILLQAAYNIGYWTEIARIAKDPSKNVSNAILLQAAFKIGYWTERARFAKGHFPLEFQSSEQTKPEKAEQTTPKKTEPTELTELKLTEPKREPTPTKPMELMAPDLMELKTEPTLQLKTERTTPRIQVLQNDASRGAVHVSRQAVHLGRFESLNDDINVLLDRTGDDWKLRNSRPPHFPFKPGSLTKHSAAHRSRTNISQTLEFSRTALPRIASPRTVWKGFTDSRTESKLVLIDSLPQDFSCLLFMRPPIRSTQGGV